ncbi:uncharacterized protein LOC119650436 isoform X1 [Hermetia illucens]|uniref:uncharacterized protein LOC119650436 isoform X1 n=1 Tax=Hermetia illucens TaxID=343691 RepID=UPI0018CC3BC6|nr:uncharacterized protein LOC119650436 isoform X1 [Hermetia illucens]
MKKLSVDEKEKFIKILKENSAVWDLSEAGHRKSTVLAAAWEKISKEMKRPGNTVLWKSWCRHYICAFITVAECKTIYRSFKDLARYRGRKKQCQKSGSELIQDESESPETSIGNEEDCAEFSVCLDFLQPNSSKRRTFSTSTIATEEDVSSPASDGSQYNFNAQCSSSSQTLKPATDLTKVISDMIAIKKSKLDEPKLKYMSMHANLDRLYCQLPADEVEKLNHEFF